MRVLSLFPKYLYDSKMSLGRTMYLNYLGSVPGVELVWSGVGWKNWDSTLSTELNIRSLESGGKFDAIIAYKTPNNCVSSSRSNVFVILNEANDAECFMKDISGAGNVVFHHYGDYQHWKYILASKGIKSYNWNHAAPASIPYKPWSERSHQVVISGCTAKQIYPIRNAALKAADEGFFRNPLVLPHPGYRLPNRAVILNQYIRYLKSLSSAKISICCSSVYRYPLAKMFESAACGCVVATDLPNCPKFEELLWPHCIPLAVDMSPEDIAGEISIYTDEELRERSEKLREVASTHFTCSNWADCLISAIKDAR